MFKACDVCHIAPSFLLLNEEELYIVIWRFTHTDRQSCAANTPVIAQITFLKGRPIRNDPTQRREQRRDAARFHGITAM
jgi:hypothetical protein